GSGFPRRPLRRSGGRLAAALAISGAPRLMAHGSYAAVAGRGGGGLLGGLGGGSGVAAPATAWVDGFVAAVVVGSGVFATVESPAPQPPSAAVITAATRNIRSPLTVGHRTAVEGCFPEGGADTARPLDFALDDRPGSGRFAPCDLVRRPANSPRGIAGCRRRRLRVAVRGAGGDDPCDDGGLRCGGPGADRHRKDRRVRDPDPVEDRHVEHGPPRPGPCAHPPACPSGRRGLT